MLTPICSSELANWRQTESLEQFMRSLHPFTSIHLIIHLRISSSNRPPAEKVTREVAPKEATSMSAMQDRMVDLKRSASEYFPMIKRGFTGDEVDEESADVMPMGWKHDIASRKEREEALRYVALVDRTCIFLSIEFAQANYCNSFYFSDEVRRFEIKVKKFYPLLEEGVEVTMWQWNRSAEIGVDGQGGDDFVVKSSSMTLKLHRRGELLVQTVLTFNSTGGYLSKALGRHRREYLGLPIFRID